ncbi:MAG: TolC family protein [Desulfopila sp.]|jgi:outer membrane protein TolC|nr:TolC family protein [Desulfopila sp.]
MKVFSVVVGILLLAVPSFALDLAEMQSTALAKRELIKRNMINLEKSEKDLLLARAGYFPSVDISYQANALDEDTLLENRENSVFRGAVSWNVFNGFFDKYQIESAELLTEVEKYQLQGIKQDILRNVAVRYLDVYERRANLEVARKNFETLEKIYQDGKNRLEVGLIDRNELLKIKVDLDNSDIQVEAARAGLEKSVLLLGREIGEELELAQLDFVDFKKHPTQKNLAENMALMLTNRSELLALGKLIDASRFQAKSAESTYYPKVNLVGSYQNLDDEYINGRGDLNQDELRAQLQVSVNLYQGGATREAVAKARLESMGLQYDEKELKDTLQTELRNLHIDFEVSLRNIEVARGSIEQAEENLRITRLKYNEGLQRESELLDAVANLSRAQFNYVAVVRVAFLNHYNILRAIEAF